MKKLRCSGLVFFVIIAGLNAREVEPSHFRFRARVIAISDTHDAVRVHLPATVLSRASLDESDIRLFSEEGIEIPFVIYSRRQPSSSSFSWKIKSYLTQPGKQTLVLEKPDPSGTVSDLLINTPEHNFERELIVYTTSDGKNWIEQCRDLIFDYSAQINLRKTSISIAPTDVRQLKVEFVEKISTTGTGENLMLKYKDLSFAVSGSQAEPLRIESIISRNVVNSLAGSIDDEMRFVSPKTKKDKNNDTVIPLGCVNLPVHEARVKVRNTYFYRTVVVHNADHNEASAYVDMAHGEIFRIPGMPEATGTLDFSPLSLPWIQLRIINQDNPPLDLEEIILRWRSRDLYFIPEKKGPYTLCFGSTNVPLPRYESAMLVPDRPELLQSYPGWGLGPLEKNPAYKPFAGELPKKNFEKILFKVLVAVLFILLSIWIFGLIKKISLPPSGGKPE